MASNSNEPLQNNAKMEAMCRSTTLCQVDLAFLCKKYPIEGIEGSNNDAFVCEIHKFCTAPFPPDYLTICIRGTPLANTLQQPHPSSRHCYP